ncbi:MAG: putative permease YicO [Alphaproteobacteria bacterium ADurb.Bin438]|nr:MAG: putative permease YicO [Alphaproteobacteria bacterium ADurb.Bin438]
MTMAYIIVVNPSILSATGMDKGAVMTATIIVSIIGTLVMAIFAKLPIALAPGMGLNAFFAYTICGIMGYSWQFALTVVFFEGVAFIILTYFNIREAFLKALPDNIKKAIPVGVGLFITLIGLFNSGIIIKGEGTPLRLGNVFTISAPFLSLVGVVLIGALLYFKVRGALLIGIFAVMIIGIPLGLTVLPNDFRLISLPSSLAPTFLKFDFSWVYSVKGIVDFLFILFTLLLINIFDTLGILIGVVKKTNLFDKQGNIPNIKQAFLADAFGTTFSGLLGSSVVTAYLESAAGVSVGGKTGLTSLTVAFLFFIALFLSPIFLMVPVFAVAPVLIVVGLFMMSSAKEIDFEDYEEAIPAFFTMIMMPFAYSIAEGIIFGILFFIMIKLVIGKYKKVPLITYIVGIFFILRFLMHI